MDRDKQKFPHKIVIISLPFSKSIYCGCSKEPSQRDGSFEYPQHKYWMRNKEINIPSWGLSGRVLDSRPRGRGFEPHRRHCVVVLDQDTFILA